MKTNLKAKTEIKAALPLLLLPLLGGCRFGNYSSTTTNAPKDPVTGYYDANPSELRFCAAGAVSRCNSAPLGNVPEEIATQVTNPVALILTDASTGEAALTAAFGDGKSALPIWVGADNRLLYYVSSTAPQVLWLDSTCTTTTYLHEEGEIVPSAGHVISGSNNRTIGSLSLKVQVTQNFEGINGSCAAELELMKRCYQDVSQCGGGSSGSNQQRQAYARSIFGPYIDAGALVASEIPALLNVAYEVHYQ